MAYRKTQLTGKHSFHNLQKNTAYRKTQLTGKHKLQENTAYRKRQLTGKHTQLTGKYNLQENTHSLQENTVFTTYRKTQFSQLTGKHSFHNLQENTVFTTYRKTQLTGKILVQYLTLLSHSSFCKIQLHVIMHNFQCLKWQICKSNI